MGTGVPHRRWGRSKDLPWRRVGRHVTDRIGKPSAVPFVAGKLTDPPSQSRGIVDASGVDRRVDPHDEQVGRRASGRGPELVGRDLIPVVQLDQAWSGSKGPRPTKIQSTRPEMDEFLDADKGVRSRALEPAWSMQGRLPGRRCPAPVTRVFSAPAPVPIRGVPMVGCVTWRRGVLGLVRGQGALAARPAPGIVQLGWRPVSAAPDRAGR